MSGKVERTLRIVGEVEAVSKPVSYRRMRRAGERLAETLKLHREGNALFKGGNPRFDYVISVRHVDRR